MDVDHEVAIHHDGTRGVNLVNADTNTQERANDNVELASAHLAHDARSTLGHGIGFVGDLANDLGDGAQAIGNVLPARWTKSRKLLGGVAVAAGNVGAACNKAERVIDSPYEKVGASAIRKGAAKRRYTVFRK